MEAALFNEIAADKEVIKSLRSEIERLQGLIMLRTIVKTVDGKFYEVTGKDELSLEEVSLIVARVNNEAAELNALVGADAQPEQPVAPEQLAPIEPATPADQLVNPPQPADPLQPAGENPNPSPADQNPAVTLT